MIKSNIVPEKLAEIDINDNPTIETTFYRINIDGLQELQFKRKKANEIAEKVSKFINSIIEKEGKNQMCLE